MKTKIILAVMLLAFNAPSFAKKSIDLPAKGKKVFITSTDQKAIAIGNSEIKNMGYWQVVDDKNNADFIIDYKIRKTSIISFLSRNMKGNAQIIDAKTEQAVFTSKTANTFAHLFGANHRKQVIQKLTKQIEKNTE
jgi:hypothetical protein